MTFEYLNDNFDLVMKEFLFLKDLMSYTEGLYSDKAVDIYNEKMSGDFSETAETSVTEAYDRKINEAEYKLADRIADLKEAFNMTGDEIRALTKSDVVFYYDCYLEYEFDEKKGYPPHDFINDHICKRGLAGAEVTFEDFEVLDSAMSEARFEDAFKKIMSNHDIPYKKEDCR